jgi:5-methylcytosine-specific restriction protein A
MVWSKLSRHERGYNYKWTLTRKRILERDCGLCQCSHCKASGAIRIATEVDHIISKAKAREMKWTAEQIDADDNLQAINTDCHKRKTQEEQGRKLRPKVQIGADGWPVDS